jgi:hypothetical protein
MGTPRDIDEIVADEEGLITVDGLDRLPCAACPLVIDPSLKGGAFQS